MKKNLLGNPTAKRGQKTRNLNSMTESAYWAKIRSILRNVFRYWKPAQEALKKASRPYIGDNKRQKVEYACAWCGAFNMRKNVHIDHIVPCGSLKCAEDIIGFIQRLTPESVDAYQVLCISCHNKKTKIDRDADD